MVFLDVFFARAFSYISLNIRISYRFIFFYMFVLINTQLSYRQGTSDSNTIICYK
jgi:hypothetical protein